MLQDVSLQRNIESRLQGHDPTKNKQMKKNAGGLRTTKVRGKKHAVTLAEYK